MKSNELRVGNILTVGRYDVKVIEIHHLGVQVCDLEETQDTWEPYVDRIKPIPLTEEWLLNFGFLKENIILTGIAPLNLPDTFSLPNSPFSYSQGKLILTTGTGDFCVDTKYVHQLQNLYFELTGKELTLKLD